MAGNQRAWGIEVGVAAVKAICLERSGDQVAVSDFCVIPHSRTLGDPDLSGQESDAIVRFSLGQLISQKSLEGETLVMNLPGQDALIRFAKLPPAEPKAIPGLVEYEAKQQIPFPIEEVEWDYQAFQDDDSPEIEVGIFATTRAKVQDLLSRWSDSGLSPEALTVGPLAVLNAVAWDSGLVDSNKNGASIRDEEEPLVVLDIGTHASDVVIAHRGRCWIRTFPVGGTHFTQAVKDTFHLPYAKAESLKQDAASSKYTKQIMQAMRPVFSDLLDDLQKTINYYQGQNPGTQIKKIVGLGSTFRIAGLRKFLGAQLGLDIVRLDEFQRISVGGREAASFAEHTVTLGTAYGLALQGVGLGSVEANLVPSTILRTQMWAAKTKWFVAAGVLIALGLTSSVLGPIAERGQFQGETALSQARSAASAATALQSQFDAAKGNAQSSAAADNIRGLLEDREVWNWLVRDVHSALDSSNPQRELLRASAGDLSIDPGERRLVRLRHMSGVYSGESKRVAVTMHVEVTHDGPNDFLNRTVAAWLRQQAEEELEGRPYTIVADSVQLNATSRTQANVEADGTVTGDPGNSSAGFAAPAPGQSSGARPGMGGMGMGMGQPAGGGGGMGMAGQGRRARGAGRQAPGAGLGGNTAPAGGQAAPPTGGAFGGIGGFGAPRGPRGNEGSSDPSEIGAAEILKDAVLPTAPARLPSGTTYYIYPVTFEVELDQSGATPSSEFDEYSSSTKKSRNGGQA
ncbi:MAG: type IV pilus assembly protein PilM [Planctomycetota bacterium]|jgi:type IV pilus assembly protein PilM|nr:MAG: hypothetical protein CBD11_02415 [Phycisphaera sp. TMED151]RPG07998.1 MAG: type IV pilus assembly protein PilM [Phycisphaera sp. TMED24]RZO53629.1 MAG: type IV pilus assembly protein PilM [Phycisphaeraceae bacterium]